MYKLRVGSEVVPVFCHMHLHSGCGGGGWTTVMKIDGAKVQFLLDFISHFILGYENGFFFSL